MQKYSTRGDHWVISISVLNFEPELLYSLPLVIDIWVLNQWMKNYSKIQTVKKKNMKDDLTNKSKPRNYPNTKGKNDSTTVSSFWSRIRWRWWWHNSGNALSSISCWPIENYISCECHLNKLSSKIKEWVFLSSLYFYSKYLLHCLPFHYFVCLFLQAVIACTHNSAALLGPTFQLWSSHILGCDALDIYIYI